VAEYIAPRHPHVIPDPDVGACGRDRHSGCIRSRMDTWEQSNGKRHISEMVDRARLPL
jgi:hypothetical protein